MSRIRFARGIRKSFDCPLNGELFFDVIDKSLYIWINNKWVLVGGELEQIILQAGDNIQILEDGKTQICEIRLNDDINVNTMTLKGENGNGPVWKGMIKLGEVTDISVFPLVNYDPSSTEILGGKILVKYIRDSKEDYGTYQITASSSGKASVSNASVLGADGSAIKDTIGLVTLKNGKQFLALKTHSSLRKTVEYSYTNNTSELKSDVDIVLNSEQDISLQSKYGKLSFTLTGYKNTGNLNEWATGNQWYEASMDDFRTVTGIPLETGLSIDQFGPGSFIYFDIYSRGDSFSVDRVFVTNNKCYNEDQIVSGGRIFCHDPYWMTPNDKHFIDISDSFILNENIFTSTSDNNSYSSGVPQFIFSVYMTINQSSHQVTNIVSKYLPPEKIEVWFNGWDFTNTPINYNIKESDIVSYIPYTLVT